LSKASKASTFKNPFLLQHPFTKVSSSQLGESHRAEYKIMQNNGVDPTELTHQSKDLEPAAHLCSCLHRQLSFLNASGRSLVLPSGGFIPASSWSFCGRDIFLLASPSPLTGLACWGCPITEEERAAIIEAASEANLDLSFDWRGRDVAEEELLEELPDLEDMEELLAQLIH